MDDIFAQYYEDLLVAQYKASEELIENQHLARGIIREEFLKDILLKKRSSIKITKGFVKKEDNRSGECDQIFYNLDSPVDELGGHLFIEPKHSKFVLEIKSNATGTDFKDTNNKFHNIKSIDPDYEPLCGLFCYNIALKKESVLNRFGWVYDKSLESWSVSADKLPIYPNIDFVICIACKLEEPTERVNNQFCMIKDDSSGSYQLRVEYPIIKNLFTMTDNL